MIMLAMPNRIRRTVFSSRERKEKKKREEKCHLAPQLYNINLTSQVGKECTKLQSMQSHTISKTPIAF